MTTPLDRYARFMGSLSRDTLPALHDHVAPGIRFRDPFNDVTGAERMEAIFDHMYETIGSVRFEMLHHAMVGETGLLHWRMHATLRQKPWSFEGMSHVQFNEDGKVVSHIDHWDAAREFYEHFPVIGWTLSAIRRRLAQAA